METSVEVSAPDVWVVDDSADDRFLIALAAQEVDRPISLTFVESGSVLVEEMGMRLPDQLPDLVVLDLRMPGLDGHATLELMREDPVWAAVPVVVFSTTTRIADRDRAIDLGAITMVSKPSLFADMVSFVDSLVGLP